ncbi:hypothetical protein GCM10010977_31680 [Citricoccus zhacaiensis]|uniref:DUF4393 domain-containing protein n=1 Tax=Citricoccus zhacaiensis TaxID=489142 RepID=A0ABQ2MD05_9MICC|nr:hypothetical protein [Citricoccus zhacaiensis]GGO49547.1 hypothetical protein GCM10010977_31680 [Citricoccus zhacaiensis]
MSELEIPDLAELGMPGIFTGAGALGLYWTLGPSIKAVGSAFGQWTEYRMNNLLRIGERVSERRDSQSGLDDGKPRAVHPRLAADLIENSSWIDDELHQEYFAGLIAGETGSSDDGLFYSRIVSNLTSSQVRLHFLIYRAYEGSFAFVQSSRFNGGESDLRQLMVRAPKTAFAETMEMDSASGSSWAAAVHGLEAAGLVTEIAPISKGAEIIGAIPSLLGAIVYHRALSYTPIGVDAIRCDRDQLKRIGGHSYAPFPDTAPKLTGVTFGLR